MKESFGALLVLLMTCSSAVARLGAGAAQVDITPTRFPVIVNGGFRERTANQVHDQLMSRALVLDDGKTRLAIVIVDNLMIPRELLDQTKQMASEATGIPPERMLIAATHTHFAPSVMGCLGSGGDEGYRKFLPRRIAASIEMAVKSLVPARIGWTVTADAEQNHCRRWIFRPDRMMSDPFGQRNVRAHMHPGYQSPNHIGPAGPADPDLSLVAVQTTDGRLLAVLANYAMHYYGSTPVSADVCGQFGEKLAKVLDIPLSESPFVGMLSQGTSGDSMWMDYSRPAPKRDRDAYTEALARVAAAALRTIEYHDEVPLAMAETTLKLHRRVPDDARLAWAREIVEQVGDRLPKTQAEIYAREQILLHERPEVELKLQAVRIGELGITAIPDEVYGITGLKLKAQSPLQPTFNIELANGAQGYIPPPEQHVLGGYTTWPARTAGLEVSAEPQIVATLLELLERVGGRPRRPLVDAPSAYAKAVLAAKPVAYWRLGEMEGSCAKDATGRHNGVYEPGVVFYLPGAAGSGLANGGRGNRAAHFAGGRVKADVETLGDTYSIELWFWNGLPVDVRPVTGYFFSLGKDGDVQAAGDHLGIGGTYREGMAGKLIFFNGNHADQVLVGHTPIPLKTWNHVVFVRYGQQVTIYLNGQCKPELNGRVQVTRPTACSLFLGGRCDRFALFEGKLDEVALYDRALAADEVAAHFQAAACEPPPETIASKPAPSESPASSAPQPDSPPLSPAEALAALHVRKDYRVELVAAEPLVVDPVAIDWGPDGRLWVAEMADYPLGIDGQGAPGGRIRVLEDTDGDGKYDKATVFLDGVAFPNGVKPWRNGVLVTAAPEIFYAEDTDGDGRADKREVLLSGFLEGNQQLRVNGLRWGLDNWIYCASGSHRPNYGANSRIRSLKTGAQIPIGSRDFRFRPDTGELVPLSGPTQFGRSRDDWGNWFGCMNSWPMWHYVLEDRYLVRNPHFPPPDPRHQVITPLNPRVYPAKEPQKRYHTFQQSGRFTSACSPVVYRDELLFARNDLHIQPGDQSAAGSGSKEPARFDTFSGCKHHAFACEPTHNLVQHNLIMDAGVSFAFRRDEQDGPIDFFASKDRWCRPVMVRTGPDGALWVVDMYRYMIEHPQWLPPEGRKELEPFYRSGDDRGRIYRVFPKGAPPRPIPRLDKMRTPELVAALESPNGIVRDLAQQLLVWRADRTAIEPLRRLARESVHPLGRLQALCTLDGLSALDEELLIRALNDRHPGVRRQAVRLAESWAVRAPAVQRAALALLDDPDVKVRLQLTCALGEWPGEASAHALAQLAIRDTGDVYQAAAVMSSINKQNIGNVLHDVLAQRANASAGDLVGRLLALSVALGELRTTLDALDSVIDLDSQENIGWQFGIIAGLLDALERCDMSLAQLAETAPSVGKSVVTRVGELTDRARTVVGKRGGDEQNRRVAVRLLGREPASRADDIDRLGELLVPQTSPDLQLAVVAHLGTLKDREVATAMLAGWSSHGLKVRAEILRILSTRKEWLNELLDAIEQGDVAPSDIDAGTRQALLVYPNRALRTRIAQLLATSGNSDRQLVLQKYRDALQLAGDAQRGLAIFQQKCIVCHKLNGKGVNVGPNLASITDRRPIGLLTSLLDPSAVVDGKFVTYVALTESGRVFSGILATETGSSITLLGQENKSETILRNQLEELRSTGKSLMPDGLEKELTRQDCADLIAYLRDPSPNLASTGVSK